MNLAILLVLSASPMVSDSRADANHPACIANTKVRNQQLSRRQEEIATHGYPITDVIPVADECALPASAEVKSNAPELSFKDGDAMKRFVREQCGDVMNLKDGKAKAPTPAPSLAVGSTAPDPVDPALGEQKLQQCQAAFQQLNSYKAAKSTQSAWKLVAGTCAAGCAASWSGAAVAAARICMGAMAGGVTKDIISMKEFTGVASAIAGPVAGKMVVQQITDMLNKGAGGYNNQAATACGGAASSALNVILRGKTAKSARESFTDTAKTIAALATTEKKPTFGNDSLPPLSKPPIATGPGTGGGPPGRGPGGGNGRVSASAEVPRVCGEDGARAALQCASAVDKTLPKDFASDEALKEFEKFSGLSPADLLKDESDSPTRGLAAAMGGNGGALPGDAKTLASALQRLETAVSDPAESVYASGGGGSGGGGGASSGDAAMAEAVKALMGGLNGEQTMGDENPVTEVSMTDAKMNRSPAAIENDRALSLFERVTYRYKTVTRRMIPAPQVDSAANQQPL